MDKKLALIGELINEIRRSENDSYCLQHEQLFQANILANDIIQVRRKFTIKFIKVF